MKNALVVVASQQKGFLASLGKILSENYNVTFVALNNVAGNIVRGLVPDANIEIMPDFNTPYAGDSISQSLYFENKYGERFSMLCSYDRALGHGYLYNVDRYIMIERAKWEQEKKYGVLLNTFQYYEELFSKYSPEIVLTLSVNKIMWLVSKKHGALYLGLALVKYKDRLFWYDEPEYCSELFRSKLRHWLDTYSETNNNDVVPYEQEVASEYINSRLRFSYWRATKEALRIIFKETSNLLRGLRKKHSYPFLGWLPSRFYRVKMYRYFQRHGKRIEDFQGKNIVFFPLHLEPETALLSLSPEFSNSMEMIAWISKSLPANTMLVLKEHLICLGMRSKRFYDMLRRIPNVCLAHPSVSSWQWIKASSLVTTITGTAAIEAVFFDKPVLSFGEHQIVNQLPTVRFASNYSETRKAINELLINGLDASLYHKSKWALFKAQMDISFSLPGFEATYAGIKLQDELAIRALEHLNP